MEQLLEKFSPIELHPSDVDKYIPSLARDIPLPQASKQYLEECQTIAQNLIENFSHPHLIEVIRCRQIDHLIVDLFERTEQEIRSKLSYHGESACLIAQGGYGRGEMNLHSDIDLVFLFPKKRGPYIESLTERMLYILWDLDVEVGYATRTIAECTGLLHDDVTIMTSLLDARYLAGDKSLLDSLLQQIKMVHRARHTQKKFIKAKLAERDTRIKKFGDSVFLLEPNVKESAGGLRDLQTPLWLAKILGMKGSYHDLLQRELLSQKEYDDLIRSKNYLSYLRNLLHLHHKKKIDRLSFDRQEWLAKTLCYSDQPNGILAVEDFMQTYYQVVYRVYNLSDMVIRRLTASMLGQKRFLFRRKKSLTEHFYLEEENIQIRSAQVLEEHPEIMMDLFEQVQLTGRSIHPVLRDELRRYVSSIDDAYRCDPQTTQQFRRILSRYDGLGLALRAMHECHFMDEWLPEFKKLRFRVQHDIYHTYTVDIHSVFAVNELSKLAQGDYDAEFPELKSVLNEVRKPELLTLGLFLHDIGKGEGGQHSEKGAVIANGITQRLHFTRGEQKKVEFLVLAHLAMPHLSQRRDIDDPELIIQFAKSMVSMDRLNMMYLLTWADIRAVGPDAWTDWKGLLLQKLYQSTREILSSHEFSTLSIRARRKEVKVQLVNALEDKSERRAFADFIKILPARYLFSVEQADVLRHFKLHQGVINNKIMAHFDFKSGRQTGVIEVLTVHDAQAFSRLTGLMLVHGFNIIRADVYQIKDGTMLFTLMVSHAKGDVGLDTSFTDKIDGDIRRVMMGEVRVETLLEANRQPDYLTKKPLQKIKDQIVIDNVVSAYSTVIDVFTHDRLGLLYDLTKTLHNLGLFVEVSKISTKVEQVTDVFYVKDIFGHKITNAKKLGAVKAALTEVISPPFLRGEPKAGG